MTVYTYAQERDRGDLIILGLAYSVTDAELKKHFEQYGEVVSAEVGANSNTL